MIFVERTLYVEPDTGHVAFVYRWRCTCGAASGWLVEAQWGAAEHAASHA